VTLSSKPEIQVRWIFRSAQDGKSRRGRHGSRPRKHLIRFATRRSPSGLPALAIFGIRQLIGRNDGQQTSASAHRGDGHRIAIGSSAMRIRR